MSEDVKQCIEGRKMAFSSSYELTDLYQKKVNDLFKKFEEFGKTCPNALDFETKLASSSLNKEYTDLFTEIATNCKCIIPKVEEKEEKSNKSQVLDEVLSDVKYVANDITMPARRAAREEFDKKMRDTPLGKIEQISNTASVFRRFFKK